MGPRTDEKFEKRDLERQNARKIGPKSVGLPSPYIASNSYSIYTENLREK